MANNQDQNTFPEWAWFVLFAVLGVPIVIVLIALAIAAYRSVLRDSLPFLLSVGVQVIVAIAGVFVAVAVAAVVSVYAGGLTLRIAAAMVSKLEQYDQTTLDKIKGRVPAIVTGALLIGNGALIYIDKAFGDDTFMVLAASLTCTFLFATANWLMMSPKRGLRRMGWGLWGLTLLAIPIIVLGYYSWTPRYVLGQLFHPLDLSSQLATLVQTVPKSDFWKLTVTVMSTVLIVVLFLGLPLWTLIFRRPKDADTMEKTSNHSF